MTGIVVVSHSAALAQAAVEMVCSLFMGCEEVHVEIAAGAVDGGLGTDVTAIMRAIERCVKDSGDAIVVADVGSSVMSAQMALELSDESVHDHVHLSGAPLVEGLVAIYGAIGVGKSLEDVARDAHKAAEMKARHVSSS